MLSIRSGVENGFDISIQDLGTAFPVYFEGWHDEFETLDTAYECVAFGLSCACRLKVLSRGGKPYRWIVQARTEDDWVDDSETGLLFFRFWSPKTATYLQNCLF